MGRKRLPFVEEFKEKSIAGGTVILEIAIPEYRSSTAITFINTWNDISASTSVRIKFGPLTSEKEIDYVEDPQIGERITWWKVPLFVIDGYKLFIEWAGVSAGDTVTAVVVGWREEVE